MNAFERYIEANEQIEYIYFGADNGAFVMNVTLMTSGGAPKEQLYDFDPRTRPWYIDAIENRGQAVLTNPYTAPSGYEFYLTAASVVEDEEGNINGVIGIDLNINNLSKYLSNVRSDEPGVFGMVQDSTMIKIDELGVALVEADMLLLDELNYVQSEKLKYHTTIMNGEPTILVVLSAAGIDWDYFIAVPRSVIDDQVEQSIMAVYIPVLIFFAVFMLFVILFMQRVIVKPIVTLKDTTSAISETGDLSMSITGYGNDEIGILAESFNQMIYEIKKNRDTLEEKIDSRTRELKEQQMFLESLINNSPSIIFVKDVEFKYVLVNSAWCEMFNLNAEDVYGKKNLQMYLDTMILRMSLETGK